MKLIYVKEYEYAISIYMLVKDIELKFENKKSFSNTNLVGFVSPIN